MSHAPKVIVAALGVVTLANAWMIWNAVSHPSAPATEDHWAESLAADQAIAERHASEALGWRVTLDPCIGGVVAEGPCRARLGVIDERGEPVEVREGRLVFQRGDSEDFDRELAVQSTEVAGELIGEWDPAATGLYAVNIELVGAAEGPPWKQKREVQLMETVP